MEKETGQVEKETSQVEKETSQVEKETKRKSSGRKRLQVTVAKNRRGSGDEYLVRVAKTTTTKKEKIRKVTGLTTEL